MNFILFGPPGIGKSTIIGNLKIHKVNAIDLEDLYPNRLRFTIPNIVDNTVLGGADLNPQRKYHNARKVLLYAKDDIYQKRRRARDSQIPGKAAQNPQSSDTWLKVAHYDYIVDTTNDTIDGTVNQILQLLKKEGVLNG
jgi:hypothetical protein